MSAQTAAHFDRDELDNLSGAYEFVGLLRDANQREVAVWTRLYGLVGPGRAIGTEEAAALRHAVSEARMLARFIGGMGVTMRGIADKYRIGYDRNTVRQYAHAPAYPICDPIGAAVPASYGQAPFAGLVERARAQGVR